MTTNNPEFIERGRAAAVALGVLEELGEEFRELAHSNVGDSRVQARGAWVDATGRVRDASRVIAAGLGVRLPDPGELPWAMPPVPVVSGCDDTQDAEGAEDGAEFDSPPAPGVHRRPARWRRP